MHYRIEDGHGLPHNPFKSIVAPRPIGWISSVDAQGRANLAPYSFFNGIADDPPQIMFSANGRKLTPGQEVKDSLSNIRETKEFAVNLASWDLREAMNLSSGAWEHEEDEFDLAKLEKADCIAIKAPRVKAAPATLECVLEQIIPLAAPEGKENTMILGRVVAVHIDERVLTDGLYDLTKSNPIARCGYMDYAVVREVFQMTRPGGGDSVNMAPR